MGARVGVCTCAHSAGTHRHAEGSRIARISRAHACERLASALLKDESTRREARHFEAERSDAHQAERCPPRDVGSCSCFSSTIHPHTRRERGAAVPNMARNARAHGHRRACLLRGLRPRAPAASASARLRLAALRLRAPIPALRCAPVLNGMAARLPRTTPSRLASSGRDVSRDRSARPPRSSHERGASRAERRARPG